MKSASGHQLMVVLLRGLSQGRRGREDKSWQTGSQILRSSLTLGSSDEDQRLVGMWNWLCTCSLPYNTTSGTQHHSEVASRLSLSPLAAVGLGRAWIPRHHRGTHPAATSPAHSICRPLAGCNSTNPLHFTMLETQKNMERRRPGVCRTNVIWHKQPSTRPGGKGL